MLNGTSPSNVKMARVERAARARDVPGFLSSILSKFSIAPDKECQPDQALLKCLDKLGECGRVSRGNAIQKGSYLSRWKRHRRVHTL
jgi:hypothetical protein